MSESSKEAEKKDFKYLLERYPVGTVLELGKHRKLVLQLNLARKTVESILATHNQRVAQVLAQREEEDDDFDGDPSSIQIIYDLDAVEGVGMPLNCFMDYFEDSSGALAALEATALLLVQADTGLTSEEFSLLKVSFSESHAGMPIVIGYAPEVFDAG